MVGDGKSRSLDVNSVGMRNYRLKKSGKTIPVTVADSIRQQGAALVEYNPAQPPLPVSGCLYVTTRSQSGLPASIGRLSFVVGSRQVTLTVNNRTQHSFDFTTDAATATVGVYLPGGVEYGYETRQTERHTDAAPRERSPVGDRMEMLGDSQATQRLATQAAPRPQHKKKSGDDLERARDTATRFPLNGESSLGGAPRVCTRSWQLHEKRPHHVSEAAWLAVTEPVREHHIRCLKNLKNMPFEFTGDQRSPGWDRGRGSRAEGRQGNPLPRHVLASVDAPPGESRRAAARDEPSVPESAPISGPRDSQG
eukprot:gene10497-biopygen7464